jgi:spore coat polysaccharide biosynthesis protein SpsF
MRSPKCLRTSAHCGRLTLLADAESAMSQRVVASIEARMGSSRLPGKVLMDVCGRPALSRLLERLRSVRQIDHIVLATTTAPADDALQRWAEQEGLSFWRGSEEDVLRRVVEAQRSVGGEIVVEITGDCTLLCPDIVEMGIETFFTNNCDMVTNSGERMIYPNGADVQVFPFRLLEEVERTVSDPAVREHVSLFFYEHPERYRVIHLVPPTRWKMPGARLVLDYAEDLTFIRSVYEALLPIHGSIFGIEEIASLLCRRPELININRACTDKPVRPGQ